MRLILASLCLLSVHFASGEDVTVKTDKGTIKGARKDVDNGKQFFYEFKGIKYAKAPIGPLRFAVINFKETIPKNGANLNPTPPKKKTQTFFLRHREEERKN